MLRGLRDIWLGLREEVYTGMRLLGGIWCVLLGVEVAGGDIGRGSVADFMRWVRGSCRILWYDIFLR